MSVKFDEQTFRPLTRDEIGRRMEQLASVVATHDEATRPDVSVDGDRSEPRWIRPADLIRRMRPYIVYN